MFENLNVKMIMAITREEVIGTTSGKLAWKRPDDLKFFKSMTEGKTILMGGNTYRSIGKILPNRTTIILSKTIQMEDINNPHDELVFIARDLEEASKVAISFIKYPVVFAKDDTRELMVVGGLQIYEQMLPYCNEVLITHIDREHYVYGDLGELLPEYGEYIFADKLVSELRKNFKFGEFKNSYGLKISLGNKIPEHHSVNIFSKNIEMRLKDLIESRKDFKFIRKISEDDVELFEKLKSLINSRCIVVDLAGTCNHYGSLKYHNAVFASIFDNVYHNICTPDVSFCRFETLLYGWNVLIVDGDESILLTELLDGYTRVSPEMDLSKLIWEGRFDISEWKKNNQKTR